MAPPHAASVLDEEVRGTLADPSTLALPGIDRLRQLLGDNASRSPVQHLTGLRPTQVGYGSCTGTMPASPWFQTQAGFFLNGVSALAADFALGGAILSVLPPWTFPVTSDINFTYLRPLRIGAGKLVAQGRLIEAGRNQATSEATVHDGEGRLLTHATTRCFLRRAEPPEAASQGGDPPAPNRYETPDPFARPIPHELTNTPELEALSGLEVARMISTGVFPSPWMALTGVTFSAGEMGTVTGSFLATPWFNSPAGTIYGGMLAAIADSFTTAAATTVLGPATATASLDLKCHFLRPGIADSSTLQAEGEVVHNGKTLIVSRAEVHTADGKGLLIATSSFMRRSVRDWVPMSR